MAQPGSGFTVVSAVELKAVLRGWVGEGGGVAHVVVWGQPSQAPPHAAAPLDAPARPPPGTHPKGPTAAACWWWTAGTWTLLGGTSGGRSTARHTSLMRTKC